MTATPSGAYPSPSSGKLSHTGCEGGVLVTCADKHPYHGQVALGVGVDQMHLGGRMIAVDGVQPEAGHSYLAPAAPKP